MKATVEQQIINQITRAKKVLCVTQSPVRADGIASVLSMHILLSKLGKEVISVIPDGIKKNLKFLPEQEKIETQLGEEGDFVISVSTKDAKIERVKYVMEDDCVDILITPKLKSFSPEDVTFRHNLADFDIIIVLDSPSLSNLGSIFEDHTHLFSEKTVINISNCPDSEFFGKINWVDTSKSSTSEMLFHLLEHEKDLYKQVDENIATTLLTGIIASTGSFLESSTVASGFESAGKLQELGAKQSDIIEHCFKQKSFPTLKIWGNILEHLEFDPVHKFTWSRLEAQSDMNPHDIDNISHEILRFVEDAHLSALFIEEETLIKVELKSAIPHFPWKKFQDKFHYENTEYGINLLIENQNILETEQEIIKIILEIQKERLSISFEIPLEKMNLENSEEEISPQNILTAQKTKPKKKSVPIIPAEIPFEAAFQAHESTGIIPKGGDKPVSKKTEKIQKQESPEIKREKKSGVPDWLRKSFPHN